MFGESGLRKMSQFAPVCSSYHLLDSAMHYRCCLMLFISLLAGVWRSQAIWQIWEDFGLQVCILLACISGSCVQYFLHEFDCNSRALNSKSTIFPFGFPDGLLAMTSGGNVSSLQRESLTREVDFGTAWQTCLRSFAPAQLNVTCLCPSSAVRPTR